MFKHTQAKRTLWPLFLTLCKKKTKSLNSASEPRHPLPVATVDAGNTVEEEKKKKKSCCAHHHHHRRPPRRHRSPMCRMPLCSFPAVFFFSLPQACFGPLAMDLRDCSRWNAVVLYLWSMFSSKARGRAARRAARRWILWDPLRVNQYPPAPSHIYFSPCPLHTNGKVRHCLSVTAQRK